MTHRRNHLRFSRRWRLVACTDYAAHDAWTLTVPSRRVRPRCRRAVRINDRGRGRDEDDCYGTIARVHPARLAGPPRRPRVRAFVRVCACTRVCVFLAADECGVHDRRAWARHRRGASGDAPATQGLPNPAAVRSTVESNVNRQHLIIIILGPSKSRPGFPWVR